MQAASSDNVIGADQAISILCFNQDRLGEKVEEALPLERKDTEFERVDYHEVPTQQQPVVAT